MLSSFVPSIIGRRSISVVGGGGVGALQWRSSRSSIEGRKKSMGRTTISKKELGFTCLYSSSSSSSSQQEQPHPLSIRLEGLDSPTVWHEFSPLAVQHNAINLGQGFPDWEPPEFVLDAMETSIRHRHANQYARSYAHMPLAEVLAKDYSQRWKIDIDPTTQIATAVGCTNALYCALQGLISPGDEVILLEPAFDIYSAQVRMAGGTCKFVPLRATGDSHLGASQVFTLDLNELEKAVTTRTKVLILNTPHNPTGKMFTRKELEGIASICQKHPQMIVICDEVYEHLIFDGLHEPHISMATIPGMFDQTLTLSSAGKTFSCTGWKVGWAIGPSSLVKAVTAIQQWVNFSVATPNQDAIAQSLQRAKEPYQGYESYYQYIAATYKRKRDIVVDCLETVGMTPIVPPGGFFIMADTSSVTFPQKYREEVTQAMPTNPMPRDWAMSRWLTQEVGVTAIPPSAFYSPDNVHLAANLLRFACCKGDDTLNEAAKRLKKQFCK